MKGFIYGALLNGGKSTAILKVLGFIDVWCHIKARVKNRQLPSGVDLNP